MGDLKNNAYWNSEYNEIRIGVGTGKPLDCVTEDGKDTIKQENTKLKKKSLALCKDILCHEYTHAIMGNDTNLGDCNGIPGAVNEAYADIAACFLDGNWTFGEKISEQVPMRNIEHPNDSYTAEEVDGKYYVNPTKTLDDGGVHANSTIISHAVFLMENAGISKTDLKDIWYNTIRGGLDKKTNFYSIRKLFILSCKKQGYSLKQTNKYKKIIKNAFNTVNVKKKNCNLSYKQYGRSYDQQYYCNGYFCDEMIFYGKVVEADGDLIEGNNNVLSNVVVNISNLEGEEIGKQVVTNKKGSYKMVSDLDEAYAITFHKQGYLDETMYLSDINELIQNQYYCDTVELIPESLSGVGGAEGCLFNAVTLKGVSGMTLSVHRGMNNIYTDKIKTIYTDEVGNYFLDGMEAGSYCLEVLGTEEYESTFFNVKILGGMTISDQNGYISSILDRGQMRVVLTWGDIPKDLDSHMMCELSNGSAGHVYFRDKEFYCNKKKICALDVDDITSYGPETITMYYGKTGWYHYYVHQYSQTGSLTSSNACVRVYLPGNAHSSYTYNVPAGQGRYWDVFRFNSATQRMVPVNTIKKDI